MVVLRRSHYEWTRIKTTSHTLALSVVWIIVWARGAPMSTAIDHIVEQLKWSGGVDGLTHMRNIVVTRAEAEWIIHQLSEPMSDIGDTHPTTSRVTERCRIMKAMGSFDK